MDQKAVLSNSKIVFGSHKTVLEQSESTLGAVKEGSLGQSQGQPESTLGAVREGSLGKSERICKAIRKQSSAVSGAARKHSWSCQKR